MRKKAREYLKKKELLLSFYVISTAFLILLLAYFIMHLDGIVKGLQASIHNFFGLRHRFGSVPLLHGY